MDCRYNIRRAGKYRIHTLLVWVLIVFLGASACKRSSGASSSSGEGKPISTEKKSDVVRVKIAWKNHKLPLHMEIYEPAAQRPISLWETRSVASRKEAPVSLSIPDGVISMEPGAKKTFVLIMRNTTKEKIYFFAAPHRVRPAEYSLGFKFKCLCINHAFKIPPGRTWYRVVQLRLDEEFIGARLEIVHDLIGISSQRAKDFALPGHAH